MSDRTLLQEAFRISEGVLRPNASAADASGCISEFVTPHIRLLGCAGYFGLQIPAMFGGLQADETTRHDYSEIVASACGVTAFTQHQFHTAVALILLSKNADLLSTLLPRIAKGEEYCGVTVSHLRRMGSPELTARRVAGGYVLNGHVPWISGWGLIQSFVLGATLLPSRHHLFGYVDIASAGSGIVASEPMALAVMQASGTVELEIDSLFLPDSHVLGVEPPEVLVELDEKSITHHASLPLGCARASIRYLMEMPRKTKSVGEALVALERDAYECRRDVLTWHCECTLHPDYKAQALRARAVAIVLAARAAQIVVSAVGGRAHLAGSTAQRLIREAQFYTTAVQTPDVQTATFVELTSPFFAD